MSSLSNIVPGSLKPAVEQREMVELKVRDLPPLPEVACRIFELTVDKEIDARRLSDLIEKDQALTARMLRAANSALYYRTQEVKTVRKAAVQLGNQRVQSLAIEAALMPIVSQGRWGRPLWEHALGVGVASREIARAVQYNDIEGVFVAGLLHDIGKSLFSSQHPELFAECLKLVKHDGELSTIDAEMATFGLAHTQAGTLVVIYWRLPAELSEVILHHHQPESSTLCTELCAIVNLADEICKHLGIGLVQRETEKSSRPETASTLGVSEEDIERIWEEVIQQLEEQREYLDIR